MAPLADYALLPLPPTHGLTCHVATWFWAAQEAQARGMSGMKAPLTTLQRIVAMPGGPQAAMMALPHVGMAHYAGAVLPVLPPRGTVLRWNSAPTHSAVVTGADAITGYNQSAFLLNVPAMVRSTGRRSDFHPAHADVYLIPEDTIVNAAGNVFSL